MVHNVAPVRFIHAALAQMLERGKGDIINVSSRQKLIVKLGSVLPRFVNYKIMKTVGEKVKKRWDEIEDKV